MRTGGRKKMEAEVEARRGERQMDGRILLFVENDTFATIRDKTEEEEGGGFWTHCLCVLIDLILQTRN